MTEPTCKTGRGFPEAEYHDRLGRAQAAMDAAGISALLLTSEVDLRYFTGFLTRFWQSPTRIWFLVLPAQGAPIAVIPSIGEALMRTTWVTDIRCWLSPDADAKGLGLLCDALGECAPRDGRVALPDGPESHMRLPLKTYHDICTQVGAHRITGDGGLTRGLRAVKSAAEIGKIRTACQIAGRAFARVPEIAGAGVPLETVFRRFQGLCLEEGADWVGYLAGGAGPGGYGDVISPATEAPLDAGDVLMLDTGVVHDGYFCDFDRNFAVGPCAGAIESRHRQLIDATAAGFAAARPGATAAQLHGAMDAVLGVGPSSGRLGHGLGMDLTEGLSIIPGDHTILEPGMVITLEPALPTGKGRLLVHEENVLITNQGAQFLTTPAPPDMVALQ